MADLLSALVTPSGAAHALFILGLLAALRAGTRRASWLLLAGSGAVSLVFSSGMVAAALMRPLEYSQPTLHTPQALPDTRHIVVLTAYAADDSDMPLTGRLSASTAYRVLMALELYGARADCDLIVSGDATTARVMGEALTKLGIPQDKIRLEGQSATTAQSAENLRAILDGESFFLVTSAGHMPRTLGAFERVGLKPVPVPTDHQFPRNWRNSELRPRPSSLLASDRAMHEYVGLLWYRLRGFL